MYNRSGSGVGVRRMSTQKKGRYQMKKLVAIGFVVLFSFCTMASLLAETTCDKPHEPRPNVEFKENAPVRVVQEGVCAPFKAVQSANDAVSRHNDTVGITEDKVGYANDKCGSPSIPYGASRKSK